MFPRFDNLTTTENSANTRLLSAVGFEEPESAARSLARIQSRWNSSRSAAEWKCDQSASSVQQPADLNTGQGAGPVPAWYLSLQRVLHEAPLKDTVLSVVDQFVRNACEHFDPFRLFDQTPRSLDILARIACASPFLTQTLLADPICLTSLTARGRTAEMKSREQFVGEAGAALSNVKGRQKKLTELRRFQRRELLRIGMCDAFGLLDLRFVTLQLSLLADAVVQVCLELAAAETGVPADSLAVVALGKHGGEELNYSSDVDLVLIAADSSSAVQRLARLTIDGLADNLPPGFLYRVDLRLRPWGDAGPLVSTIEAYSEYLRLDAALWEKQSLLKARTVAGNAGLGIGFLKAIRPLLFLESAQRIRTSIQQMKERIETRLRQRGRLNSEVKLGIGSIRDVEFLVQFLQLSHGKREPRILSCNTLDSLVRLAEFDLLDAAWYRQLRAGYVFLRTVEHSLQLLHNQQTHELPNDPRKLEWLANRLDYPDAVTLMQRFEEHKLAVRTIFETCLEVPAENRSVTDSEADLALSTPRADATDLRDAIPSEAAAGSAVDMSGRTVSRTSGEIGNIIVQETPLLHHQAAIEARRKQADSDSVVTVIYDSDVIRASVTSQEITEEGPLTAAEISGSLSTQSAEPRLVIFGPQFPGWLSVICGLLSICRIDIRGGDALSGEGINRYGLKCPEGFFLAVFRVRGHVGAGSSPDAGSDPDKSVDGDFLRESASQLQHELSEACRRICGGSAEEMRAELISRFCETVRQQAVADATPAVIDIDVEQDESLGQTRLYISGADAPGFLFELAHALFISQFRIVRAIVESEGAVVRDVLHVTEKDGGPVLSESRLQELRVVVVLIKQFTYWLPSTSDPHHALSRFRDLISRLQPASHWTENVQSLRKPDVLQAVARVLGISHFLWEDFLRQRHEELFPLLANTGELEDRVSRESLARELQRLTTAEDQAASSTDSMWTALNYFKDRHLFRIDMRHVLGYCRPFGAFSEEITELAELVVGEAIELGWKQLTAEYGLPMVGELSASDQQQSVCRFAAAGLGKFGGVEMGYASDIELILIYEATGRTSGRNSISNARFFDLLVTSVATGISARQDGIFHVDLRMRPFGQAGSAAVSLEDFVTYYGPTGPAWPYERQALVKFRCVSGSIEFRDRVQIACQRTIYAAGSFDFAAMRAMRERQIRQLVRGGTINAKLSDGGLADCEYAVQALQLTFGRDMPTLRHPNTLRVLDEAARLSLISPAIRDQVDSAYVFLRELIDCLRMVRGNARDLTVPDPGTADYQQLARRMLSIHDSRTPLDELESQMQIVRDFSLHVEKHCRAMRQHYLTE